MPLSAAALENEAKIYKNETPTKYEGVWVKLHTGDPGAAGTSNAAGETTRKKATLTGTTTLKNSGALEWAGVSTAESYTWVSIWSAEAAGTFLGRGEIEGGAKAVSVGDTAKIAAEGFSIAKT